jgi:hypothetical protein
VWVLLLLFLLLRLRFVSDHDVADGDDCNTMYCLLGTSSLFVKGKRLRRTPLFLPLPLPLLPLDGKEVFSLS